MAHQRRLSHLVHARRERMPRSGVDVDSVLCRPRLPHLAHRPRHVRCCGSPPLRLLSCACHDAVVGTRCRYLRDYLDHSELYYRQAARVGWLRFQVRRGTHVHTRCAVRQHHTTVVTACTQVSPGARVLASNLPLPLREWLQALSASAPPGKFPRALRRAYKRCIAATVNAAKQVDVQYEREGRLLQETAPCSDGMRATPAAMPPSIRHRSHTAAMAVETPRRAADAAQEQLQPGVFATAAVLLPGVALRAVRRAVAAVVGDA